MNLLNNRKITIIVLLLCFSIFSSVKDRIDYKHQVENLETRVTVLDSIRKDNEFLLENTLNLKEKLNYYEGRGVVVTVTRYSLTRRQCKPEFTITADNSVLQPELASQYKYVAVSRNLLRKWGGFLDFGDMIVLKNAGYKEGVYIVRDVMNDRWVNRVDILEDRDYGLYAYHNVELYKLRWND